MSIKAEKVINKSSEEREELYKQIRGAAKYFHQKEGKMFTQKEASKTLQKKLDIKPNQANQLITELVEDKVDPVIQIKNSKGTFVGVTEYREFEGAYGYLDYHDIKGKRKKVVCAQCVQKTEKHSKPFYTTAKKPETKYKQLVDKIKKHYKKQHTKQPKRVKTGATLAAGTTIAGNRVATQNYVDNNAGGVPSGTIVMWSGGPSNIPSGWTLCDGNNGAPDLRNRFVTGAGDEYAVGDTGGEKEHRLTEAELPSHNHTYDKGNNNNQDTEEGGSVYSPHSNSGLTTDNTVSTGGDEPHENRPRFYAIAYIYKL